MLIVCLKRLSKIKNIKGTPNVSEKAINDRQRRIVVAFSKEAEGYKNEVFCERSCDPTKSSERREAYQSLKGEVWRVVEEATEKAAKRFTVIAPQEVPKTRQGKICPELPLVEEPETMGSPSDGNSGE